MNEDDVFSSVMKRLDIPAALIEKFRPRVRQKGEPRCERDYILDIFLAKLNAGRIKDGYPKMRMGQLVKMLAGRNEDQLYRLYRKCEGYRAFGAGLKTELAKV